jgi:hypothetical protein
MQNALHEHSLKCLSEEWASHPTHFWYIILNACSQLASMSINCIRGVIIALQIRTAQSDSFPHISLYIQEYGQQFDQQQQQQQQQQQRQVQILRSMFYWDLTPRHSVIVSRHFEGPTVVRNVKIRIFTDMALYSSIKENLNNTPWKPPDLQDQMFITHASTFQSIFPANEKQFGQGFNGLLEIKTGHFKSGSWW